MMLRGGANGGEIGVYENVNVSFYIIDGDS